MSTSRRHFLKKSVALAGLPVAGGTAALAATTDAAAAQGAPKSGRVLLRNGYFITQDPKLGEFRGDLLMEDGRISAMGKGLKAPGAEVIDASDMIITPGFMDSHRHLWQSALRHIGADWTFPQYLKVMFFSFGTNFRPQDVYAQTLLGRLTALESGITSLLDWSHVMNSPEHADAAVQAHRDSQARSVFAMGYPQTPDPTKWTQQSTLELPDDIKRVRRTHFSSNTGLVTLQMAARGPNYAVMEQVTRDLATARELGLHSTMHTGTGEGILAMHAAKLTGPDITYVHLQSAGDDALQIIKDTGGKTSVSVLNEEWKTPWRGPIAATARLLRLGMLPSISVDTETVVPGDMFSHMRGVLQSARYGASNDPGQPVPGNPRAWNPAELVPASRVLSMATIGGAPVLGYGDQVGTLAPGKAADLVMFRASHPNYYPVNDAVKAIVVGADTSCVEAVFVAGRAVKFNGRLVNQALVARARKLAGESRDYLFAKAGFSVSDELRGRKT